MVSLKVIQQIESLNAQLAAQGMRMETKPTHGAWSSVKDAHVIVVYPSQDGLPFYARDAELFIGTLDDIQLWISGIQWLTAYYNMIGIDTGTKREQKEHAERERQLIHALSTGNLPKLKK